MYTMKYEPFIHFKKKKKKYEPSSPGFKLQGPVY